MKFTKKDLLFSVISGLITGFLVWRILNFLEIPTFRNISFHWLVLLVPVLWIAGVNLGYFLGRWIGFFSQFGKFTAIGFTNASVDFAVLNSLIYMTDITSGVFYSLFKGASFLVALFHSYLWNKYWVFDAGNDKGRMEFLKFFTVAIVALLINVGVSSAVVNWADPILGLDAKTWANVGAVVGSATALIFSFAGFKLAVFNKK